MDYILLLAIGTFAVNAALLVIACIKLHSNE